MVNSPSAIPMEVLCKLTQRLFCPWAEWKEIEANFLRDGKERTVWLERRICQRCGASEERPLRSTDLRRSA